MILAYVDAIVLVGRTTSVLQEGIIQLSKAVKETGLTISLQNSQACIQEHL
jgi:hypothetical protein